MKMINVTDIKEKIKAKKKVIAIAAVVLAIPIIAQMLILGTGRADPNAIRPGWLYTLKAADDSGQVSLYTYFQGSAGITVPDGTELKVTGSGSVSGGGRVKAVYEDTEYFVNTTDLGEGRDSRTEAEIAAAQTAEQKRKMNNFIEQQFLPGLYVALFIATLIILQKKVKARFAGYYAKKRQEFPWLENWIKTHGDPEPLRMKARLSGARISIIAATVIGFFGGSILAMIIRTFVRFEGALNNNTTLGLIITPVMMLLAFLWANRHVDKPQNEDNSVEVKGGEIFSKTSIKGLTLECPQCGCPHSWGLASLKVIVKKVEKSAERTSTTTTTTYKNPTPDFIDFAKRGFSNGGRKTKTRDSISINFEGTKITGFFCENCKHSPHTEEESQFIRLNEVRLANRFRFANGLGGGVIYAVGEYWDVQHGFAKWATDFARNVNTTAAMTRIPAKAAAELQERTAEYTGTYKGMSYLDAEFAAEFYHSYLRQFFDLYFEDLPDDTRALLGLAPGGITYYAWTPPAEKEEKNEKST